MHLILFHCVIHFLSTLWNSAKLTLQFVYYGNPNNKRLCDALDWLDIDWVCIVYEFWVPHWAYIRLISALLITIMSLNCNKTSLAYRAIQLQSSYSLKSSNLLYLMGVANVCRLTAASECMKFLYMMEMSFCTCRFSMREALIFSLCSYVFLPLQVLLKSSYNSFHILVVLGFNNTRHWLQKIEHISNWANDFWLIKRGSIDSQNWQNLFLSYFNTL